VGSALEFHEDVRTTRVEQPCQVELDVSLMA